MARPAPEPHFEHDGAAQDGRVAAEQTQPDTVAVRYPSLEVRDMVLKIGMEKGAAISDDRLDDVASRLPHDA